MVRVLSGIQPTGDVQLGNYLGAIRLWARDQHVQDSFFCVVDLHALTVDHDPTVLADKTRETAAVLMAAGLDPDVCTLFVQGHVPQHTELSWILECTASFGELRRMTQFKEKSQGGQEGVRVGLFTYPVLQAADILIYDADRVPVGDDQRQHVELCRDLALRFNHRYGDTFRVPEPAIPEVGARVMDLQEPTVKMSKSRSSPLGKVDVLEAPESIVRKIKRAVTDNDGEVVYDPRRKPGVSNLLELLAVSTGARPQDLAGRYTQYGPLKADTAEAVVELLRPLQARFAELSGDPAELDTLLAKGATKAEAVAAATLARARDAVGLLRR